LQKCKKAQKSAQRLEKKGDSSSKGANLKAGEGQRGRQAHPGIFWKECAIACGQRSCETLLEQRGERERKESAKRADEKEKATQAVEGLWPINHNSCYQKIQYLSSNK
jgi:ribosomal protein L15